MHAPHIGETVLVHHPDTHSNGAHTVPAIVQQVFNTGPTANPDAPVMVNLIAFPPFMSPKQLGSVAWHPSTPLIHDEHFIGAWPRQTHHTHVGEQDSSGDGR